MNLLFSALLSLAAFFQNTGVLAGNIHDTFGKPVSRAAIQAKNTSTGMVYRSLSKESGEYTLERLPDGVYELIVRSAGMKKFVLSNVVVHATENVRTNVTLEDNVQLRTLGDGDLFGRSTRAAPPVGPTPRMPDGKPDLSGFWAGMAPDPFAEDPEGLPWAEAVVQQRIANDLKEEPTARCLPSGITQTAGQGKFVQTPTLLVILIEFPGNNRQIYLDGRPHPKGLEPTWLGHSVGRWEGDTLVVDTVGFNDKTWLTNIANPYPHTEKLHVIERYRRPDLGHLELEMTIEDPGALKKPWIVKRKATLDPTDDIMEYVCNENEKDALHTH